MRVDFALPFSVNYPQGFRPSPESGTGFGSTSSGTPSGDTIDISVPLPGGIVTVEAGDMLSLRDLYSAGSAAYSDSTHYRVALRDNPSGPGGGRLMLDDQDVTDRVEFTAMEFARLQFIAGADGAETDLVVVARSGTPDGAGGLRSFVDSQAVQITARVTGTRSINAAEALRTEAGADEAAFLQVVKDSMLHAPIGNKARPTLTTVGNFTSEAGDMLSLRDLYSAGSAAYSDSTHYRVALRDNPSGPGGGRLMLDDQDVTDRVEFTAMEFARLQFIAGADGAETDLVVVARSGTPDGAGGLRSFVDSQAVQITARVTGTRSINAAEALRTEAGADEAAYLQVVKDSMLHAPLGSATRPSLTSVGQPDAPPIDLQDLAALTGAFQSAGAAAASAGHDLRSLYPGALGSSVTASPSTNRNLAALLMLLGVSEVGGRETTGNKAQHLFAAQAYLRNK
jgi:hypothetical protein